MTTLRKKIEENYFVDEEQHVKYLIENFSWNQSNLEEVKKTATDLINSVRNKRVQKGGFDALLVEYDLSNAEGIALMCLAEALLRTPDKITIDKLIKDKLSNANWKKHLNKEKSLFVNATTWGLALTGKMLQSSAITDNSLLNALTSLIHNGKEAIIRKAVQQAMKMLGEQFIMGHTIEKALNNSKELTGLGFNYSFDMLGEAAKTKKDALKYYEKYVYAINKIGEEYKETNPIEGPGISIKLSALHPRYEGTKEEVVFEELYPKMVSLIKLAKEYNIGCTIDAEESNRLDISLKLIEKVITSEDLSNWEGFGLAIQAYQKRAPYVIDWLGNLCKENNVKITVRLVKGAYWDSEIKRAQESGLSEYPVLTKKNSTDLSYLVCAKKLFKFQDNIFPQFATHNAFSVSAINNMAPENAKYEYQCLHGMGDTLYNDIVSGKSKLKRPCRIYAPVGEHDTLLAYLVRRILENGANSSFVNQILDKAISTEELITDPLQKAIEYKEFRHRRIPKPEDIYLDRKNSTGYELSHSLHSAPILQEIENFQNNLIAKPTSYEGDYENLLDVLSPENNEVVGKLILADDAVISKTLEAGEKSCFEWNKQGYKKRAKILEKAAILISNKTNFLISLLVKESGKTIKDAIGEVRETIDFCNYYSSNVKESFKTKYLIGPTGEINQLNLHGRGTIVCISPWNFPLAIFSGQILASLVAGNSVIAKPATQTPLIAQAMIDILHEAGIPEEVLQFLPIKGKDLETKVLIDQRINGVVFTGSTSAAKSINLTLAKREGAIVPLIAETGGLNCMLVDSTALFEQAVDDVIISAFNSAGQRCSALRVLYIQEDIKENFLEMLKGAMAELKIGSPEKLDTDIGPVIDKNAKNELNSHISDMADKYEILYSVSTDISGNFVLPTVVEIPNIKALGKEVFGPILHIISYKSNELNKVIDEINSTGYGLTLGVHSRIQETIETVSEKVKVGNIYVNRNMIGAVVGVQPFGGEGCSGTGPKAGGPNYITRLATERTISNNTSAIGGNTTLMTL